MSQETLQSQLHRKQLYHKKLIDMTTKHKILAILVVVIIASLIVGGVYAATILTSNHVTGTPQPTPTPTPSPTPTPTPNPNPTTVALTQNATGNPFIGDTLHLTATLNKPVAGIAITFYNASVPLTVATTDSLGIATYNTQPVTAPYDFYSTATIP